MIGPDHGCESGNDSYSTSPELVVTRRIKVGSTSVPSFAKAPYADTSESIVTSPDPSASDGTCGMPGMPNRSAYSAVAGMPTSSIIRTAARLLDTRSASRIVNVSSSTWPSCGYPCTRGRQHRIAQVPKNRGRSKTMLQRRGVQERLERRSRLPSCLGDPIEAALVELTASDERPHFSCVGIEGDERRLQRTVGRPLLRARALASFNRSHSLSDFGLGRLLHVEIERGLHFETFGGHALPTKQVDELLADFLLEVPGRRLLHGAACR